ncbi:MAG TPA: methionyl-tRNA formyltransferase [Chloroflexota bacterium]|nr:methionyl-tRNA formyltransferase [Chloroflexota bacterium]
MTLIFAGTPEFAVPALEALVAAGHRPALVLTQPDRPAGRGQQPRPPAVKVAALAHQLPVAQPERLGGLRERLGALEPHVVVVVAYAHKIPGWLLELPPWGCLNIHASLLPRYRGASPVAAALLHGDSVAGVSIMRLDAGWDTGPVLAQHALPVAAEDTAGTLTAKLAEAGAELLVNTLAGLVAETVIATPQDNALATYAPKLTKADGLLDWALPAEALVCRVRAFTPWPGAYAFWQGRQLKVLQASAASATAGTEPGRVLPGARVGTADGVLRLERVQLEGRKPLSIADFLAGQPSFIGSSLTSARR